MGRIKYFVMILMLLILLSACIIPFGKSIESGADNQSNTSVPVTTHSPTSLPGEISSETPIGHSSDSGDQFVNYHNDEWGISLNYPQSVLGDPIFLIDQRGGDPNGIENIYLLSNIKDSILDDFIVGQKHYAVLYREKKDIGGDFDEWAVRIALNAGPGNLQPSNLGNCKSFVIQSIQDGLWTKAVWVNASTQYIGLLIRSVAPGNSLLNQIFDYFKIQECDK